MDNFEIDVTAEGYETLLAAIEIAFRHNAAGGKADGYDISEEHGLIFLWAAKPSIGSGNGIVSFPFKMDPVGAADFAARWLKEQEDGPEPDPDGHNGRGWRVYCETWGHVGEHRYAICAVQPRWAMYGK